MVRYNVIIYQLSLRSWSNITSPVMQCGLWFVRVTTLLTEPNWVKIGSGVWKLLDPLKTSLSINHCKSQEGNIAL